MNYNPEEEGTHVKDFLLGLKLVNLFLVWAPEVGKYIPLIRTLWQEDTPLIRATFPAASLYKDTEEGGFCSLSACLRLASTPTLSLALEPTSLAFLLFEELLAVFH